MLFGVWVSWYTAPDLISQNSTTVSRCYCRLSAAPVRLGRLLSAPTKVPNALCSSDLCSWIHSCSIFFQGRIVSVAPFCGNVALVRGMPSHVAAYRIV